MENINRPQRELANLLLAATLLSVSGVVSAAIVGVSGSVILEVSPNGLDLTNGALESNEEIAALNEIQGLQLAEPLSLNNCGVVGVIQAGAVVDSHFLHFDTVANRAGQITLQGGLEVDGLVLGVLASDSELDSSDSIFGLPTITYPTGLPDRATLFGPQDTNDDIRLTARGVSVSMSVGSKMDQLRVVASSSASDTDTDGIADGEDNCILIANSDQRDTDGDGIGNACDADLTNDCTVNFEDLGVMKERFFSSDQNADLNGDGFVNFVDLGIMKAAFFSFPGPSGQQNSCETRVCSM